ncbi:ABC transporter permease [uncultured Corynebacterium sp.]|uniref:ABC transporter permease n=1 Tax=uncultured Corynebacterium sp. TaxID=159447 RepID=UPI0025DE53DA|nr:ABC transporter permease [uncultured Corynebacterium sp.]
MKSTSRFEPGFFAPAPQQAKSFDIVKAQAKIESLLFLRHGEQQLLSMVIPLGLLIGLTLVPGDDASHAVTRIFPMALAIALMGAGFTGQAIAVAFDRRYGALKRIGAAGVPTWALIAGKVVAVCIVVLLQVLVLSIAAFALGWRPDIVGFPAALLTAVVGVAAFTSLGMLLGGTLSSELVLALGNTIWFVLLGAAVYATMTTPAGESVNGFLMAVPSVALMEGFHTAVETGSCNLVALASLLAWAVVGTGLALKFFRFTMESD